MLITIIKQRDKTTSKSNNLNTPDQNRPSRKHHKTRAEQDAISAKTSWKMLSYSAEIASSVKFILPYLSQYTRVYTYTHTHILCMALTRVRTQVVVLRIALRLARKKRMNRII